ncbi:hypothetical protein [Enterobacter hormaechei]
MTLTLVVGHEFITYREVDAAIVNCELDSQWAFGGRYVSCC